MRLPRYWEFEDLARHLCGLDENAEVDLNDALQEKFGVDLAQFTEIAGKLLPLCAVGESRLSGKIYRGFAHNGAWLAKEEVVDIEAKETVHA